MNLFAYCENNPVNRADPTGHSWKSFWNKVGNAIETVVSAVVKAVKTVAKETVNTANKIKAKVEKPVSCIWESIEFDVGVGGGVRGGANIDNIGLDIGYSTNVIQLHISDGKASVVQSATVMAALDMILYDMGYKCEEMHDLAWNPIETSEDCLGIYPSSIGFGAVAYVGIGGSISMGFNWEKFLMYLDE